MELGISPIVTSGMIIQLLNGVKILEFNMENEDDQRLYEKLQNLAGIIIGFLEAVAYVWGGMYGDIEQLGLLNASLIVIQLIFASYMTILLDEVMNNGYGLGSGINLFISVNMCETILWSTFSPMSVRTESGQEYEGAIIALFHGLITRSDKLAAIQQAFYRSSLPNINNLLATVLVFLIVIYFQGFKVNAPVVNNKIGASSLSTYPIKLFYTSNVPIILQSALISNLYFISQLLYKKFRGNLLVRMLGQWQELDYNGHSVPVAGLAYYISPPQHLSEFITDPIHVLFYIVFILGTCALFSRQWIEISGQATKDVLKQLKQQDLSIKGHQRDISQYKYLNRYIPVAATFGGICTGALSITADFMGAMGSGTGILLCVSIIYGYFETFQKEKDVVDMYAD